RRSPGSGPPATTAARWWTWTARSYRRGRGEVFGCQDSPKWRLPERGRVSLTRGFHGARFPAGGSPEGSRDDGKSTFPAGSDDGAVLRIGKLTGPICRESAVQGGHRRRSDLRRRLR